MFTPRVRRGPPACDDWGATRGRLSDAALECARLECEVTRRRLVVGLTAFVVLALSAGAAFGDRFYQCGYDGYCTAAQGAPSASTGHIEARSSSTVDLQGEVIAANQPTTYGARYDVAASSWCTSKGASGTPAHTTPSVALAQSDGYRRGVLITISGLTPGAQYCGALKASNDDGDDQGAVVPFTASVGAATEQVYTTGATTAAVVGAVNPGGQAATYRASYDTADSPWCTNQGASGSPAHQSSAVALGTSAAGDHDVVVNLSGLSGGTRYCAAVTATNASGTASGLPVVSFFAGVAADTQSVRANGMTTATVEGTVNPVGLATTYAVSYDTAASAWCTSGGTSGTAAHQTTPQKVASRDALNQYVTAGISGLSAGTKYCAALTATNTAGTATGIPPMAFTAGAPAANTYYATPAGATSVTLFGSVNPTGQSTTFRVAYDSADSVWCQSDGVTGTPAHQTASEALGPVDAIWHSVQVSVTGLTAGARYCGVLAATNSSGAASGEPVPMTPVGLQVYTWSASFVDATSATVFGSIDPLGLPTTYHVAYDVASSAWCTSGGTSGTASSTTASQMLPVTTGGFQYVTVPITGISNAQEYCAELVASNDSGTVRGSPPVALSVAGPDAPAPPLLYMKQPDSNGPTAATVTARIAPRGSTTNYKAQWATAASTWCRAKGTSGSAAGESPSQTLPPKKPWASWQYGTVAISSLTGGQKYCALITATNASGTVQANEPSVFTVGLPDAQPNDVLSTGPSTATVTGWVTPANQTTTYRAAYGLSTSVWCQSYGRSGSPSQETAGQPLPADNDSHSVTVNVTGLSAGASYCAALVASNGSGNSPVAYTQRFTSGLPSVEANRISATGATAATLEGTVNPASQTTTYFAQYDLDSSDWCQNGGQSGVPAHETPAQTLGASDATDHAVSVTISGLTAGAKYCAILVASNAAGDEQSWSLSLTSGLPTADIDNVESTGTSSATVHGTVNPAGQQTSYKARYDTSSSDWCSTGGYSGAPAHTTTASALGATDASGHAVAVPIAGLAAGTTYCVDLQATNGSGHHESYQYWFAPGGGPPPASPPTSLAPPTISGAAAEGQTLTLQHGSWSNAPTGYGDQWMRCAASGSNCAPIAGGYLASYKLTAADVGHTIRVQEIASNASGPSAPALSAASGVVQAAGAGGGPTGSGPTEAPAPSNGPAGPTAGGAGQTSPPVGLAEVARAVATRGATGQVDVPVTCPSQADCAVVIEMTVTETLQGKKVVGLTARKTKLGRKTRRVVVGRKATKVPRGKAAVVRVALNATGRRLLKANRRIAVKVTARQDRAVLSTQKLTLSSRGTAKTRKR